MTLVAAVPATLKAASDAPPAIPLAAPACPVALSGPFDAGAACEGIRPGAALTGPSGGGAFCTLAWALRSGSDVYVTTAGHCVGVGQRVGTPGVGAFGTTVARMCGATPLFETCEPGFDYALIRVDAAKASLVTNDQCAWGTPARVLTERDATPRVVKHHGYGLVLGGNDLTRAREGVSVLMDDARKFGFWGAAAPGDSGSAAMAEDPVTGEKTALGIITHIVAYTEADPDPARDGTVTGTRLDAAIADLNAQLGLDLKLL